MLKVDPLFDPLRSDPRLAPLLDRLGLIQKLPVASIVLPVQALGELFNVLVRKAKRPATNARASWP